MSSGAGASGWVLPGQAGSGWVIDSVAAGQGVAPAGFAGSPGRAPGVRNAYELDVENDSPGGRVRPGTLLGLGHGHGHGHGDGGRHRGAAGTGASRPSAATLAAQRSIHDIKFVGPKRSCHDPWAERASCAAATSGPAGF